MPHTQRSQHRAWSTPSHGRRTPSMWPFLTRPRHCYRHTGRCSPLSDILQIMAFKNFCQFVSDSIILCYLMCSYQHILTSRSPAVSTAPAPLAGTCYSAVCRSLNVTIIPLCIKCPSFTALQTPAVLSALLFRANLLSSSSLASTTNS